MAGYNEILEGRFNRAVQRLFNMKGAASVNELASIITPQLSIHVDADQRYNEGWESYSSFGVGLANATAGSAVQLRNPLTSNVLAVVTRILLSDAGGAANDTIVLEIGAKLTDYAGASTIGRALDTRITRFSALVGSINPVGGAVALGSAVAQVTFLAGGAFPTNVSAGFDFLDGFQRVVLTPGFTLQLRNATINQGVTAVYMWEERTLGDAEGK